jgi:hypothetical protein
MRHDAGDTVGIFSKFGKAYQIGGSKTHKDTVSSVECLARTAFGMLAEKSANEQTKVRQRVTELLKSFTRQSMMKFRSS